MTTWTREQVGQARGIRAQAMLDHELVARARDDDASAREMMFRRMNDMAHAFALELHPADIQFDEAEEDLGVKVIAWWKPQTLTVELSGGPRDGKVWDVQGAPDGPVMVAIGPAINWHSDAIEPTEVLAPLVVEYRMSGWSESQRRWVYSPR